MPRQRSAADARRKLDRLRALARSPQLAPFVLELIAEESHPEVLLAALQAFADAPQPGAHDLLVARYQEFERAGRRRDAGGFVRAALLRALEPIGLPSDLGLFERAVAVREPSPQDEAAPAGLRAAALIALLRLEPELASYHAVAMLHDERGTSLFTGEPAVTAARVLAAAGQELVLVAFVLNGGHPEVTAECLRELRTVPPAVLPAVVEAATRRAGHDAIGLGLCDLFVRHQPEPALASAAAEFLRSGATPELYHYLAAAIVAERREDLLEVLGAASRDETNREKLRALHEALDVRRGDPAVQPLLERLDQKLERGKR